MTGDARPIGAFFDIPHSSLGALLARAEALQPIQRALQEWRGAVPTDALRVVNFRDGVLIVHADDAAALTALRYHSREFLQYFRSRGYQCREIQAKTKPRAQ